MDDAKDAARALGIGEFAAKSGVSARTLRHYESLGLLLPRRSANGYRVYDARDAKRLAQIVAMRKCGLPLATIGRLMSGGGASLREILADHLRSLRAQGDALSDAIARTESAMRTVERIDGMDANDAFEELKAQGLKDFEETYGQEARELYGAQAIDDANERMMSLTQDEWDAKELLEESIKVQLRLAMASGDPEGEESQEFARMHERWIGVHWGDGYKKEEYLGLVRGYLKDPRFVKYYDSAAGDSATEFLVKAVEAWQEGEE